MSRGRDLIFITLGLVITVIFFAVFIAVGIRVIKVPKFNKVQTTIIKDAYVPIFREDINKIVILDGGYFINKYDQIIKNRDLTEKLIIISLEEKVPINITVATCAVESIYDPNFNKDNKIVNNDGSRDRGAMGINDKWYKIDYYDIESNVRTACQKLRTLYEKYISWEIAVVYYNAGNENNLSQKSLNHLKKIMDKERELNISFASFYNELKGLK